ncbi:DUF6941 family protein [Luteimicrobium subarcticum]|uniref:Uncharacterized protein n=1 Tax=Luteimicrobium subarcticum TaxID=620910 RepID=A0A2M8W1C1_9MICO|nr:hypothetical protein [Luteimicrobium subarcticum]PJI84723.1 hypothetical protein CLV34_3178 [Luteimicrobium subarcticum]
MKPSSPTELTSPVLFLADHAAVESGKLYVNGGCWNRLTFPDFPASVTFSVVAVILVPWRDTSSHEFTVRFEDPDGSPLGAVLSGELTAGTPDDAHAGDPTLVPITAVIDHFTVERPGDYTVVLEVDGERKNDWSFRVLHLVEDDGHGGAFPDPSDPTNLPFG